MSNSIKKILFFLSEKKEIDIFSWIILVGGDKMSKKYPFIKQKESKDCGIDCLLMIFKYYNGYVNPIKLEELTKTTKNGVTAYHLVETLKYYGFKSYGIKCKLEEIKNQQLPAICHVTINKTYNHYMVIYKITSNHVIVADPSDKVKKISIEDFQKIYNDILIVMSPRKELPKYFESISKFGFCISIIKKYKSLFYKLLIFSSSRARAEESVIPNLFSSAIK